jgi:5-methylcytosine-specific restriction protein A
MPKRPPVYRPPVPVVPRAGNTRMKRTPQQVASDNRASASARGYDATWQRLRRMHLNANPWCVFCLEKGLVVEGEHVDHKLTIRERPDLRLDPENLQTLCAPCHNGRKQRLDRERFRARARARREAKDG